MKLPVVHAIVLSFVAAGMPALAQAALATCDGVVLHLRTSDIAIGSAVEVDVTVRSDLVGKVSGVVQFAAFKGSGSILSSANKTFSVANTKVVVNTKPTSIINNYKGTLLGVVNGVQCEKRVEGALDLHAP
ncbi:hypothetical protein [Pseudomonas sp. TWP3-2]|uniref:hypothetical protein n=1 Tax=Pseudomonas sp. TWP3-2 TaxID=2804574 RepID=UPI003CE784DE